MKYISQLKVGDVVSVYADYQTEKQIIGTARLTKFHSPGRTFILEEMMPEISQIVYNYEEWYVDWIGDTAVRWSPDRPVKIRFLDTIGIANSTEDIEDEEELSPRLPIDKFISVNGIEIY